MHAVPHNIFSCLFLRPARDNFHMNLPIILEYVDGFPERVVCIKANFQLIQKPFLLRKQGLANNISILTLRTDIIVFNNSFQPPPGAPPPIICYEAVFFLHERKLCDLKPKKIMSNTLFSDPFRFENSLQIFKKITFKYPKRWS